MFPLFSDASHRVYFISYLFDFEDCVYEAVTGRTSSAP